MLESPKLIAAQVTARWAQARQLRKSEISQLQLL